MDRQLSYIDDKIVFKYFYFEYSILKNGKCIYSITTECHQRAMPIEKNDTQALDATEIKQQ